MSNQVRSPDAFEARLEVTLKPFKARAAVGVAKARHQCRHALLMVPILLAVFIWSAALAEAASPYDQVFMRHEIQASAYELSLAQLGQARALRPEVRAYAETVVNDQARYNEALRDLARSKEMPLPPGMGRRDKQRLDRLGSIAHRSFDAAFLREARRINGDGVRAFRTDASRTADPEIRALVMQFQEVAKQHQSLARSLSNTVVASRAAVIRPPPTRDPIVVVPAPGDSPMPIIQPPSDAQHGIPSRN